MRWLWEALSAIGIGLLIGLEREQQRSEEQAAGSPGPPDPHAKGARTFSLIALYGYATALCGDRYPALPVLALVALAGLLGRLHLRDGQGEDVTTEVAALCAAVLGMLAHVQTTVAVALGVTVTAVLIAKPWVRRLVPRLRRVELLGTLELLVALVIVLPVMPDRPLELPGPLAGALNPRTVVLFVVLTAGVGYAGYFLVRLLGAQRGISLTGLVGGLTSSTAVTLAMGARVRENPELAGAAAVAALLSCAVMAARVVVIALVVSAPLGLHLLVPSLGMLSGYLTGVAGVLLLQKARGGEATTVEPARHLTLTNPFELGPAVRFGLFYVGVLVVARVGRYYLGTRGLYLAAALSGLADVDAITLASARMVREGSGLLNAATTAVYLAVAANTLVKGVLAFTSGGAAYGARVALGHAVALLLGGLGLGWLWLANA